MQVARKRSPLAGAIARVLAAAAAAEAPRDEEVLRELGAFDDATEEA